MNYYISRDLEGKYLQRVEPNKNYCASATAPTMGNRHVYAEYSAIWGNTPVQFERITVSNHIKVILEEFRWGAINPFPFRIEPECGPQD